MNTDLITSILSLLLTGVVGLLIWFLKREVVNINKTQQKQTIAFNELSATNRVATANSINFERNCLVITNKTEARLNAHSYELKKLNKRQGAQDILLSEHERRLNNKAIDLKLLNAKQGEQDTTLAGHEKRLDRLENKS